jgi:hypothetical protein
MTTISSSTLGLLRLVASFCLFASSSHGFHSSITRSRYPTVTASQRLLPSALFQSRHISSDPETDLPDDLTKQELALRFKEVLAYFASVPPGDSAVAQFTETYTPQLSLLRGRLDGLHLNRCKVLPSTIKAAGNGLFATRDCKEGELITLFPGDAILLRDAEMKEVSGVIYGKAREAGSLSLTDDAARAYEIRTSPNHSIVGDQSVTNDAAYLGHIANDGASLTKGDDKSRTVYSRESAEAANASFEDVHGGCHFGLFCSRPISSGDEIFVSYGEGYWLSRSTNQVYGESQRGDEQRRLRANTQTKKKKSEQKNKGKKGKSSTSGKGF